jgi:hypothetical protein
MRKGFQKKPIVSLKMICFPRKIKIYSSFILRHQITQHVLTFFVFSCSSLELTLTINFWSFSGWKIVEKLHFSDVCSTLRQSIKFHLENEGKKSSKNKER